MRPHNPNPTGRKIRRTALMLLIVLAAGFLATYASKFFREDAMAKESQSAAAAPALVDIITVSDATAGSSLSLPGETAAWYESTIYARVEGYVASWSADIGDNVKKGQVLATIETPELDAQLEAAKAKLTAAQADAEFARTTYNRWKDSPKGVVSEQEREEKKAAFTSSAAQVKLDQAEVDRYRSLAAFKQVTAPYDGRITERRIDIGNLVTAGSGANTTPLYRITQNNPMRVFIDVPQSAATEMKQGLPVNITAGNVQNRIFKGEITRTADAINQQSRTLHVEVDLKNDDGTLVPGMYVDASFSIASQGWLQIPAAALIFRNSGAQVALMDKDHKVHFQNISIARDNGSAVEVGSGLSVGDQVALNISNQVGEGDSVQVNPSQESEHAAAK